MKTVSMKGGGYMKYFPLIFRILMNLFALLICGVVSGVILRRQPILAWSFAIVFLVALNAAMAYGARQARNKRDAENAMR
jgi:hypothetical protein